MHRDKYYCPVCDWAAKGPCPQHGGVPMSSKWRPGKKNTPRVRLWDDRVPERRARVASAVGRTRARHSNAPYPAYDVLLALGARDRWSQSHGAGIWGDDPVRIAILKRRSKSAGY